MTHRFTTPQPHPSASRTVRTARRASWFTCMLLLSALLLLAACATTSTSSQGKMTKAERRLARQAQVQQRLDERRYTIEVEMMHPTGLPSRHLNSDFSLEVIGDSIYSYLPYVGRAYEIPYGGGKALHFSGRVSYYRSAPVKDDLTRIEFGIENEEDRYIYTLEVFDNGSADIDIICQRRDRISFSGRMVLDY